MLLCQDCRGKSSAVNILRVIILFSLPILILFIQIMILLIIDDALMIVLLPRVDSDLHNLLDTGLGMIIVVVIGQKVLVHITRSALYVFCCFIAQT